MSGKMKGKYIFLLLFCSYVYSAEAQIQSSFRENPLSLVSFLEKVRKGNLEYISEQLNVSIAEADLAASRVFPDPELSFVYSNNDDKNLGMGQSVEAGLSYPVNLGNKRGAGITLSKSKLELSSLLLDTYFRNLRAEAARTYYSALAGQKINALEKETYDQLHRLAVADSIKLTAGEGSRLDAMQSMVEARSQLSQVFQSTADMEISLLEMLKIQGLKVSDTLYYPTDNFPVSDTIFDLAALTSVALRNRGELMAAIKNREISENNLRLIKATRAPDINLQAGYSYNTASSNIIAPAPKYNSISAGISVPLKFSGFNRGAVRSAELALQQSEIEGKDTEMQVVSEVFSAFSNFSAQARKAELYSSGIVTEAKKILDGRIYSYQRGETGLTDVLTAQRSYIELEKNYIRTMFDYSSALIDLELAAGIWTIR